MKRLVYGGFWWWFWRAVFVILLAVCYFYLRAADRGDLATTLAVVGACGLGALLIFEDLILK